MTQPTMSYPTTDQHDRWQARAEEVGMSLSQFVQSMVEAGIKADRGFDVDITPDSDARELREQRNDLKQELDRLREREQELEQQAFYSEAAMVQRYIEENPGVGHTELIEYMQATVPERIGRYLDSAEVVADLDENGQDGYYPR